MKVIIMAILLISLLFGGCQAVSVPEPTPLPEPPTPQEPEPGPNMKVVAAELSWAEKYMEDFISKYPVAASKKDIAEYERPAFYRWGYTDDDFPVHSLGIHRGGSKYYLLIFMPASNILAAKGYIEDAVFVVANEFELIDEITLAQSCLQFQSAMSYDMERQYVNFAQETEEIGVPGESDVREYLEEYRKGLNQIILRLQAAETELSK